MASRGFEGPCAERLSVPERRGQTDRPVVPLEVAQVARRHFKLQNTIHWVKSIAIDRDATGAATGLDRDMAVGHYKPINSDRFVNDCHEFIFHFSPAGAARPAGCRVPYQDRRTSSAGPPPREPPVPWQHLVHPCRRFKAAIATGRIRRRFRRSAGQCEAARSESSGTVLDPFLGLGNTALAALRLGLDFVGVELDPYYLKEAVGRVRAALTSSRRPESRSA
jgi:site-specific DNA-methyltransferase (adenine-specific)